MPKYQIYLQQFATELLKTIQFFIKIVKNRQIASFCHVFHPNNSAIMSHRSEIHHPLECRRPRRHHFSHFCPFPQFSPHLHPVFPLFSPKTTPEERHEAPVQKTRLNRPFRPFRPPPPQKKGRNRRNRPNRPFRAAIAPHGDEGVTAPKTPTHTASQRGIRLFPLQFRPIFEFFSVFRPQNPVFRKIHPVFSHFFTKFSIFRSISSLACPLPLPPPSANKTADEVELVPPKSQNPAPSAAQREKMAVFLFFRPKPDGTGETDRTDAVFPTFRPIFPSRLPPLLPSSAPSASPAFRFPRARSAPSPKWRNHVHFWKNFPNGRVVFRLEQQFHVGPGVHSEP